MDEEEERLELQATFLGFCKLLKINARRGVGESELVPPLCGDCTYQLTQLLIVRKMVKDFKNAFAGRVKELKEKCVAAEEVFRTRGIYKTDKWYQSIRQQIVSETKPGTLDAITITPDPVPPGSSFLRVLKASCGNNGADAKGILARPIKRVTFTTEDKCKRKVELKMDDTSASLKTGCKKFAGDLIIKCKKRIEARFKRNLEMGIYDERRKRKRNHASTFKDATNSEAKKQKRTCKRSKISFNNRLAKLRKKEARGKFECPICVKPISCKQYLQRHKFTHYNQHDLAEAMMRGERILEPCRKTKAKCEQCGKILCSEENLRYHRKVYHGSKKVGVVGERNRVPRQAGKFKCTICNMGYSSLTILKRHQMARHSTVQPFKCPQCAIVLGTMDSLQEHLMRHQNIRPFKCTLCSRCYVRPDHLRRHERIYHFKGN